MTTNIMMRKISKNAINIRRNWVSDIQKLGGNFANEAIKIENRIGESIEKHGIATLIDHLRLCSNTPKCYHHDSSEEKLYSKYTDNLLCFAYKSMGLKSVILDERSGVADVDAFAEKYSFVADAKVFRLSRTAKNQKDFKVQAMDSWKHGKPYAMIVCPIYQLPSRSSQIYHQSCISNVCVFTYSHLSLLVNYAMEEGNGNAQELLHEVFKTVARLNPSKSAVDYWLAINKTILSYSKVLEGLWCIEKEALAESIEIAKSEELKYFASERERIMRMKHDEALQEIIRMKNIENKVQTIQSISGGTLFKIT